MASQPPRRTLSTTRLLCLLTQLQTETRKSMDDVARGIGVHPSLVSKLKNEPFRNVRTLTIEKVTEKVGLDPRFFTDPKLGNNPDYRRYLLGRTASAVAKSPKKASSPKRSKKQQQQQFADAAAAPLDSADVIRALDMLYASPEERDALHDVVDQHRFPFINQALVQAIISGIRKGQRMQRYVDDALSASIDEEMAKSGADDDDAGDDAGDDDVDKD